MANEITKYATAATFYTELLTAGTNTLKTSPTLALGDVKVNKLDGNGWVNIGTLPAETAAGSGVVAYSLTDAELTAANVLVRFLDQTATAEWDYRTIHIKTFGHASAAFATDPTDAVFGGMTGIKGAANAGNVLYIPSTGDITAINSAPAGTLVLLGAGTFNITAPLAVPAGVKIRGQGKLATTIQGTSLLGIEAALITLGNSCSLEDCRVISNTDFTESCPVAVKVTDAQDVYIRRCQLTGVDNGFANANTIGVYAATDEWAPNVYVEDCDIIAYGAGEGYTNIAVKADEANALRVTGGTLYSTVAAQYATLRDVNATGTQTNCTIQDTIGAKTSADTANANALAAKASADTAASNATTAGSKADAAKGSADTAVTQTTETAIKAAMTAQGVTTDRAAKLDNLDRAITAIPAAPTAGANADAVWDELLSGHAIAGSGGAALSQLAEYLDVPVSQIPGWYTTTVASPLVFEKMLRTVQNQAATVVLHVEDSNSDPIDLSAKTLRFVAYLPSATAASWKRETGDGITVGGTGNGTATVTLTTANTATATQYRWLLWDVTAALILAEGTLDVRRAPINT